MRTTHRPGWDAPALEAEAVRSSEGRWPRICAKTDAARLLAVRCDHVF
jgi:hypothetical protein